MHRHWTNCLSKTTAHALPNVVQSPHRVLALIWLALFILASSVCALHMYKLISQYVSEPTTINMDPNGATFHAPDIHLCRSRPLSHIRMSPEYFRHRNNLSQVNALLAQLNTFQQNAQKVDLSKILLWSDYFWASVDNQLINDLLGMQWAETLYRMAYVNSTQSLPHSDYELQETYHTHYFKCVRIRLAEGRLLQPADHLIMQVFMEASRWHDIDPALFVQNVSLGQLYYADKPIFEEIPMSLIMYFTDMGHYPFDQTASLWLSPGQFAKVSLSMEKFVKVSTRQSPCVQQSESMWVWNSARGLESDTEFASGAEFQCIHQQALTAMDSDNAKCRGCLPFTALTSYKSFQEKGICENITNILMKFQNNSSSTGGIVPDACVDIYRSNFNKVLMENQGGCSRLKKCEQNTYEFSLSSVSWPSRNYSRPYQLFLIEKALKRINPASVPALTHFYSLLTSTSDSHAYELMKQNIIQIHIHCHHPVGMLYQEELNYGMINLVSDIGGILGLYLGMSLLTIFEFVNLFYACLSGARAMDAQ